MAQLNSFHRVFGVYGHAIPMNHIQTDATQICNQSDIIDLHLDTWIPKRLWGYHPNKRHRRAIFGRHFFGHSDVPRLIEAGVTGAMWSITTNPFKLNNARWLTFLENLRRLEQFCADTEGVSLCRTYADYTRAKQDGLHAVFPCVQGANAVSGAPDGIGSLPENHGILRMTLVHLTPSVYGNTSSPGNLLHTHKGLTNAGKTLVEEMNQHRVMVDLAHIHPDGFWDAVDVHDPRPILVTHTGVQGFLRIGETWMTSRSEPLPTQVAWSESCLPQFLLTVESGMRQ